MQSELRPFLADPRPRDFMRSPTGNRFAVLVDAMQSGGSFSVLEFEQLDNVATPLHVHDDVDEGFLVLEGHFEFESAGERFEANPTAFVFLPRGKPHRYSLVGDRGRILTFFFPGGTEGYFREVAQLSSQQRAKPGLMAALAERYGFTLLDEYNQPRSSAGHSDAL